MTRTVLFRNVLLVAVALAALVVLATGLYPFLGTGADNSRERSGSRRRANTSRLGSEGPYTPGRGNRIGFREGAEDAGIDFKMAFLPGEQGENFKINLYDHGCGVVV